MYPSGCDDCTKIVNLGDLSYNRHVRSATQALHHALNNLCRGDAASGSRTPSRLTGEHQRLGLAPSDAAVAQKSRRR